MPRAPQSVGLKIRGARLAQGLTQRNLAELVGVTRATVSEWERSITVPRLTNISKLATALVVTEQSLTPFGNDNPHQMTSFKLGDVEPTWESLRDLSWAKLNRIAAGESVADVYQDEPPLDDPKTSDPTGDFRLYVMDDAMEPVYMKGDRVRIRPTTPPFPGCQVVAWIADNDSGISVLRNWVPRRGEAYDLVAENPKYPTISCNDIRPGQILGTVIRHLRVLAEPDDHA